MFSYSRDICVRNHRRFTLCSYHYTEKHNGNWKTCGACLESFDAETYAWYGTNRYNFEKSPRVPAFVPQHCDACGRVLSVANGGYTNFPSGRMACEDCYHTAPGKGEYASDAPRQTFGIGCVANPDAHCGSAVGARADMTGATQSLFDKFFRWFDAQLAHDLRVESADMYGNVIDWVGLEKIYRHWWPDWDIRAVLGHAYRTMFTPRNDLGTIDPAAPAAQDFFSVFIMAEYPINGYITPLSDRVTFLRIFLEQGGIELSPEETRVAEQLLIAPNSFLRVDGVSESGDVRVENLFMRETNIVHDPALSHVLRHDTALFGKLILDEHGKPVFAGNPASVPDHLAFMDAASIASEHYEVTHRTKKARIAESLAESLHWNGYIAFRNIFDLRTADDWRNSRFFIGPFTPKRHA
ncbi:hypothetical protein HZC00_03840 [Candidatus Kaiserbacteria bacterium]|nr:hypothetical protein [Candidatus Kaiserbacteria bacterium]